MKKVLFLALAGLALTACKKDSPADVQFPEGASTEINFTTAAEITKGQTVDYKTNTNNFFLGDQIGVYMANASTALTTPYTFQPGKATPPTDPVATEMGEAINFGYTYATPYWAAITAPANRLNYPVARFAASPNMAQLYAYFPFTGAVGSTVALKAADDKTSTLNYTYKADQTANADLRVLDVMVAKNTNTDNAGWAAQSAAIPLEFKHLMSKLNFTIRLKHGTPTEDKFYLRAIEVKGPEVNTQNAVLDVVAGTLTPATIQTTPGSVFYLNQSKVEAEVFAGVAVATPADAAGLIQLAVKDKAALTFNDLLIYPFTQTASENNFVFYLTKTLETAYTTMTELYTAVAAGDVLVYSAPIAAAQTGAMYDFTAGTNNVMNVTIDIENPVVNITATIKPWVDTDIQDIPAQ